MNIKSSTSITGLMVVVLLDMVSSKRNVTRKLRSDLQEVSDEQRLFRKLMRKYEKSVRPVINATTTVVVKLGITLTQIFDMDERNQVLTLNVWLDQEWVDEKLRWDPTKYGGLQVLRIPCDFLWLPDIVLYNSVDDYTAGYMKSLAMVGSDGNVFWPPIVRFRSSCKIDITFFPFDDQICHLKMGSWAYDGFQVDVTNRSMNVDLTNYVDNGEWELIDVRTVRRVITYACCPEPFPDVTFYLHMRRRTTYYTFNIIIPCTILSMLTIAGFFLPAESGEKVTLGLTVLLAFSVFMLLIAENLPATSEFVPLIGIYLTVTMAMTSMSVIFAVFILHLHHRGNLDRRAPPWLRRASCVLSRVVCVRTSPVLTSNILSDIEERLTPGVSTYNKGFRVNSLRHVTLSPIGQKESARYYSHKENAAAARRRSESLTYKIKQVEEDVLRNLRIVIDKHDKEELQHYISKEWEDIAIVFDRFLFWIFFVTACTATLSLLVFKPLTKDINIETSQLYQT